MVNNESACDTGCESNVISEKIFNEEIALCRKLHSENGKKCGWGNCKDCGVIPLLYKLHKGQLLEDLDEIKRVKSDIWEE